MYEYSTPARRDVADDVNLTDDVFINADRWPDHIAFSRKVGDEWVPVSSRQFADEVTELAAGLIASGISPGDRIGLMARTSYEWMLCDYAIWTAGAVTVPIYETSSAEQVEWYLGDSGAVAVFVETPEHEAIVGDVLPRVQALRHVWQIAAGALGELVAEGGPVSRERVAERRRAVTADSVATIVYTSGTTGRPKGCVITHRNLVHEVRNVGAADGVRELVFNETKSTLLFLPLAHILARVIQLSAVHQRVRLGHTADIRNVAAELQTFRPTSVLSVPRVFEKVYNTAQRKAAAEGHGRIFAKAEQTAIAWSEAMDTGGPGLALRLRHALFDRLVYAKLRAAMGGRVEYAVSGGAPLGARLGHFFRGAGLSILEGYGLTESSAGATLNLPGSQRVGTVGRPIPGCSVRIAPDGEILLSGGHVFEGYWQNEPATKEILDEDGWLHTGDIGRLDDDGFLEITGRKKDLIVTSAGKNVAPTVLEDRIRAHWLVSQCMVVGDGRPFIAALVTVDPEAFELWKAENGRPAAVGIDTLRDDPALVAAVQEAVDAANAAVSQAEAVKKFRILPLDFTEGSGELTPTLKVRRSIVLAEFGDEVEALYRH